jgi:hypothetical protein
MHATPGLLGRHPDSKYPKAPEAHWMARWYGAQKTPLVICQRGLKKFKGYQY